MLTNAISTIATGAVFGASLKASGVYQPSVIIDQFRLADFHMLHVFTTAVSSSAVAMLLLDKYGLVKRPVKTSSSLGIFSQYDGNLIGGCLVGIGMALSGACPGTVLVQLTQGLPSARMAGVGALLGASTYVKIQHRIAKTPQSRQNEDRARTVSDVMHIPVPALYLVLIAATTIVVGFTQTGSGSSLVAPGFGGLLIGLAQAISLVATSSPLGVSAVYEHVTLLGFHAFAGKPGLPSVPSRPMLFALGIMVGALALNQQGPRGGGVLVETIVRPWHALLGGFVMAFGARLGGGCTSGHGLSGLSALSMSSLVAVAGMFGAGILTRALL
ncbi:hypothetical protein Q7P37_006287 [Cladosporium fusiforme]